MILALVLVNFVFRTVEDDALMSAAKEGDVQGVRSALESGSSVNYTFEGGFTPLMVAASNDRYDVARLLLSLGADPSLRDYQGMRALDMARSGKVWNLINGYSRKQTKNGKNEKLGSP